MPSEPARPLSIEHRDGGDNIRLRIEYAWNRDNTVATRSEIDGTVDPWRGVLVRYTYHAHRRLIEEWAVDEADPNPIMYRFAYEYDAVGNRTIKHDLAGDRLTRYAYDTDWVLETETWDQNLGFEPDYPIEDWTTRNNRLVEYREYGPAPARELERTIYYTYRSTGHVSHITVNDEGLDTIRRPV